MTLNTRLQASSLANAIFICLMISILCGCLVLVSHYQNLLSDQLQIQEKLIHDNESTFHYALSNFSTLPVDKNITLDLFDSGITSHVTKKRWGFNDVLICKTVFKNDTIVKAKLIGRYHKNKNNALYLTDYDKPLRVSGKSKILGASKVPGGRIERAYLNGQAGNSIRITGKLSLSQDKLPRLSMKPQIQIYDHVLAFDDFSKEETFVNNFSEDTKIIEIPYQSEPSKLQFIGNYILSSKTAIEISSESKLKDVMIIAPEVTFKSGFKGNVHVVAERSVTVEEQVDLKYPSSIYVKNDIDSVSVRIDKTSSVLGNVILSGDTYSGSLLRKLFIAEDATVVGSVYCYGSTELKGDVIGSLYTDKFYLKTASSEYENVIQNGSIDGLNLPLGFISASFSSNPETKTEYAVIKEL